MIMLIHKTLSAYCLWGLMANGLFWSGLPMRDFFFFFEGFCMIKQTLDHLM